MLNVFGDESVDEGASRVFAVAGLIGDDQQWERASSDWLAITDGKVFHAADCEAGEGDYADSPPKENLRLYRRLTEALANGGLSGFGSAINLVDYNEIFPGVLEDQPYYMCFADVVDYFSQVAELSIPEDIVKFTFDRNKDREHNAAELYDYMAHQPEWEGRILGDELSFASRENPKIQMADLVAREAMKHLDNQRGPKRRLTRRSMRALTKTRRFFFTYYERDKLLNMESSARGFGIPGDAPERMGDYRNWLTKKGIVDTIASRVHYLAVIDGKRMVKK